MNRGRSVYPRRMSIQRHPDPSFRALFKRTIAAQSHFLGCVAAIIGMIILLNYSSLRPTPNHFWACLVYGLTSVLVFATSAIYHLLHDGFRISPALANRLENLDHFAIYLFIAGTYTAMLMNAVANPWANILLAAIWIIAVLGVLYTHHKPRLPRWAQHRFVYTSLFLAMGWLIVFRIQEVVHNLSTTALVFLVLGAASYSIGAVIYATKRPRLFENVFGFHELWHVMVLLGYGFHYFAILSCYQS